MKIKQSTFYCIRLIYRVHKEGNEIITSTELAQKEGISQGVTLRLLRKLAQAGIMNVYHGRGQVCGGFSLAKSIDEITLWEIMNALEGLNIRENLGKGTWLQKETMFRVCSSINEQIKEMFNKCTIRNLFEPNEVMSP